MDGLPADLVAAVAAAASLLAAASPL